MPCRIRKCEAIAAAAVKHADETGWKLKGKKRWLWVAATRTLALFVIHAKRSLDALVRMVGAKFVGVLCSDRWMVYDEWPAIRRQVYSASESKLGATPERGGAAKKLADEWFAISSKVFDLWHAFRGGGLTRTELGDRMADRLMEAADLLDRGTRSRDPKLTRFCTLGEDAAVDVDVRGGAGRGADEQPRGTNRCVGQCCGASEAWLQQRRRLPVRGANPDRGANVAAAKASRPRLPPSRHRRSPRGSIHALTHPNGVNGYEKSKCVGRTSCSADLRLSEGPFIAVLGAIFMASRKLRSLENQSVHSISDEFNSAISSAIASLRRAGSLWISSGRLFTIAWR
ncbi:MAG: transposase [Gemmataceae bacterium]